MRIGDRNSDIKVQALEAEIGRLKDEINRLKIQNEVLNQERISHEFVAQGKSF